MRLTDGLAAAADTLDWVIDRIGRVSAWCALAIVLVMAYNVYMTARRDVAPLPDPASDTAIGAAARPA